MNSPERVGSSSGADAPALIDYQAPSDEERWGKEADRAVIEGSPRGWNDIVKEETASALFKGDFSKALFLVKDYQPSIQAMDTLAARHKPVVEEKPDHGQTLMLLATSPIGAGAYVTAHAVGASEATARNDRLVSGAGSVSRETIPPGEMPPSVRPGGTDVGNDNTPRPAAASTQPRTDTPRVQTPVVQTPSARSTSAPVRSMPSANSPEWQGFVADLQGKVSIATHALETSVKIFDQRVAAKETVIPGFKDGNAKTLAGYERQLDLATRPREDLSPADKQELRGFWSRFKEVEPTRRSM